MDYFAPQVSVIVPFYNSEQYIGACIESLLNADTSVAAVEYLFVDNGSEDSSRTIAANFDRIQTLDEQKRGAYAARNLALRRAKAPIIAFTDADCTVSPNWITTILAAFEEREIGMVVGHCCYPSQASAAMRWLGAWENAKVEYITHHCHSKHRVAYCNNMAVRAELFAELGVFREWQRAADSEFAHRLARERPSLRFSFESGMRVTHHEFPRARERARRLRVYTGTNAQIDGFRELSVLQRAAVLARWLRGAGRD
ncbi:MAG: glycosyltransferase family 2 protein [Pseudomonadota bacterium]